MDNPGRFTADRFADLFSVDRGLSEISDEDSTLISRMVVDRLDFDGESLMAHFETSRRVNKEAQPKPGWNDTESFWEATQLWIFQICGKGLSGLGTLDQKRFYLFAIRLFMEDYELECGASYPNPVGDFQNVNNFISIFDLVTFSNLCQKRISQYADLEISENDMPVYIMGSCAMLDLLYKAEFANFSMTRDEFARWGPYLPRLLHLQAIEAGVENLSIESQSIIFRQQV